MKLPLLTSLATMAVLIRAASVASTEANLSGGTEGRTLAGISFPQQAEDAVEVFKEGYERGSKKEKESSKGSNDLSRIGDEKKVSSFSNSKSISSSFSEDRESPKYSKDDTVITEQMCDPDNTKPEHEEICEDIWVTMCNPDDEAEVDDDYCDWLGFTVDVDWVDDEDFEYGMVYKRVGYDGSKKTKVSKGIDKKSGSKNENKQNKSHNSSNKSSSSSVNNKSHKHSTDTQYIEGMCDPDHAKQEHEDICDDIWVTMCNPDDEIEVDDEYCDWLGFTADVEWYDAEDFDYETEMFYEAYDSEVKARNKNLRGGNKHHN